MSTLNRQIETLLKRQEAAVRRAFLKATRDIVNQAQLTRLRDALRLGDIDAAIRALNIDSAAYGTFAREIGNTYTQAGATIASGTVWRMPDRSTAVIRFNVTNPRAERYLADISGAKITRIAQDTIAAARVTINAGYAAGYHPNRIALDLVGRIGANGRRTGGIIGLSDPQARYVANMRARLASGDPREMRKVLSMTRRDFRFDPTIRKAIEAGKPLTAEQIDRMAGRYKDSLLQLRGEAIARSEVGMATESARIEAWQQAQEKNGIPDEAIIKTWLSAGPAAGGNERPEHQQMHRMEVRGLNTPFVLPDGSTMQHPLDPAGGVDNIVNCRCGYTIRVDYAMLAR